MAISAAREPGALGDLGPQPHGGKGAVDRIGGAQMNPVLGGVLVELQEHIGIIDDLGDRFGILGVLNSLSAEDWCKPSLLVPVGPVPSPTNPRT
jgi:hypothetical protein